MIGEKLQSSWIWRCLIFIGISLILNFLVWRGVRIEEDVVASIEKSKPAETALFQTIQKSGFFNNRVYLKIFDPNVKDIIRNGLAEFDYRETAFAPNTPPDPADLYRMLAFFPAVQRDKILSSERVAELVARVKAAMGLPGGLSLLKWLELDPLMLASELKNIVPGIGANGESDVMMVERNGALSYENVAAFYAFLKSHDKQLAFVGGDFFALENRSVVQRDIAVCTLLSLILGALFFRACCRQWRVLGLLFLGTFFSSTLGLLLTRSLDGVLYGLVLAFASTFLSFNNETLVHLAGAEKNGWRRSLPGTASAIGTTIIGFLVLLCSSSHMARQMAILALGTLLSFILFLLFFRRELRELEFKAIQLRPLAWRPWPTYALCLLSLAAMVYLPKPAFRTDLESFRYASAYLEAQTERFNSALKNFNLQAMVAVPIKDPTQIEEEFANWEKSGAIDSSIWHPLRLYIPPSEQEKIRKEIDPLVRELQAELQMKLAEIGVRLPLSQQTFSSEGFDALTYLKLWSRLSPLPWTLHTGDFPYLLAFASRPIPGAVPLHPKPFYEGILNDLAQEIAYLFLLGLGLMLLYLLPWQRDLHKVALIFMPLLMACLVLQIFFIFSGRSINIVHIMGASLVIAVALDYSSILVSTQHDPEDQGKVVLTGTLTLSSFGSLIFATHPVLRELGLVVGIGTGVSWIFALLCRREGAQKA